MSGLTGDAVIVQTGPDSEFDDDTARRIQPASIEVAEPGGTPIAVRSLDGGGIVVVTVHDDEPRVRIRQYIENPPGTFTEFGAGADVEALDDSELRITAEGATWGGDVVIPSGESNPAAVRPIATIDPAFGPSSSYEVILAAADGESSLTWTLDLELDEEFPPGTGGPMVQPFGDGALVVVSNSSARSSRPALVVLSGDGSGNVYDLGDWSIADVRPDAALLTRSSADGMELGVVVPAG